MKRIAKRAVIFLVGVPFISLIAWHLLMPRYSSSFIDLNSGRIRHVRYFLTLIPVGAEYEETILSRGFGNSAAPRWVCFGEDTPMTGDSYSMNLFGVHEMEAYMDFEPKALAMARQDIFDIWKDGDSDYTLYTSTLLRKGKMKGGGLKVFIDADVVSETRAERGRTNWPNQAMQTTPLIVTDRAAHAPRQ